MTFESSGTVSDLKVLELAVSALSGGDHKQASLVLSKQFDSFGQSAEAAICLRLLGLLSIGHGDKELAYQALTKSNAIEKGVGDRHGAMHTTHLINLCGHANGDLRKVSSYYLESIAMLKKQRTTQGQALCYFSLVELALVSGDMKLASRLLARYSDLEEKNPSRPVESLSQIVRALTG